ncbi:MAG: hypothetical protein IKQ32_05755 [Prevotella sp.]|nr:hypothetical protein [Prevotella sp.]
MIDSLKTLQAKRHSVKMEMSQKESELKRLWDGLFHKEQSVSTAFSPTKRALSFISSSTVIIDGMLLGWKLYNRFGRKRKRR